MNGGVIASSKNLVAIPVLLALLGLVASGCGGHGGGSLSPDESAFIQNVTSAAPDITSYKDDSQLIGLGHAACAGFSSGASYEELADRLALLEGSNPLPSEDLGAVIDAAVQAMCPKYSSQIS